MNNFTFNLILVLLICLVSCTRDEFVGDLPVSVKNKQFNVVVLRSDSNGVVSPSNILVDSCKDATITIVARSGYVVDFVKVNGLKVESPSLPSFVLSKVISNVNVSVGFRPEHSYTVQAVCDTNGLVTPASQVVLLNQDAKVTIVPSPGFVVDVFKVNGVVVPLSSLTYTFSGVTMDQKAEVTFKKDQNLLLCSTKWKCDSIYERTTDGDYHAWAYFSSSYINFSLDGSYSNSMNGKVVSSGKWSLDKNPVPSVIHWAHGGVGKVELLNASKFVVSYVQTYADKEGTIYSGNEYREFYSASK